MNIYEQRVKNLFDIRSDKNKDLQAKTVFASGKPLFFTGELRN